MKAGIVRAAGKKKPISVQKYLHHDLSHSYSPQNLSQSSGHLLSANVVYQIISLLVSLFQQLSNQINETHNLALLHAIRFLGKIMSLVILSQWQPGKLFLCSAHLLAVLSAVSLIQSLEGLSFSACQAGSLLTPLAVKWAAVRMLCVSCVGCFDWNICFMYSWKMAILCCAL